MNRNNDGRRGKLYSAVFWSWRMSLPMARNSLPAADRAWDLDGAIKVDDLLADGGNHRAAAAGTTRFGGNRGFTQRPVDLLDQQPRPPIRHADRAGRGRDRSGGLDRLQKRDLAGADAVPGRQIDADGEMRAGHGRPPGTSRQRSRGSPAFVKRDVAYQRRHLWGMPKKSAAAEAAAPSDSRSQSLLEQLHRIADGFGYAPCQRNTDETPRKHQLPGSSCRFDSRLSLSFSLIRRPGRRRREPPLRGRPRPPRQVPLFRLRIACDSARAQP